MEAEGVEAAGVEAAGVEAAGVEAAGVEALARHTIPSDPLQPKYLQRIVLLVQRVPLPFHHHEHLKQSCLS